jgi:hypothetical protein
VNRSFAPIAFLILTAGLTGPIRAEGTLIQWSFAPNATGGPDLSAPLVTDRPDFTEAASTVGKGVGQLEFGYTFTSDEEDGTKSRSHSFGEPLLRLGLLADWFELRLGVFPSNETVTTGAMRDSNSGLEDLYFGAKIGLTPQAGFAPEMAIIPQTTIPWGGDFSADEFQPGVNWIYAWSLTEDISTAGSTQFNRVSDDETGRAYTEWAQSWTVAASLTNEWGTYAEWFAFFPHSSDTAQVEHYANGGFTYLLSDNIQWDLRAGVGLNEAADDFFVGSGLSIRFGAR